MKFEQKIKHIERELFSGYSGISEAMKPLKQLNWCLCEVSIRTEKKVEGC